MWDIEFPQVKICIENHFQLMFTKRFQDSIYKLTQISDRPLVI